MKTNAAARRVWKVRMSLTCLAIAVVALFDLWAGGYCCRNLTQTSTPQTCMQQVWSGSVTGSEVFLALR